MSEPLSPLNQGLNPLRGAPLWGQLVALPTASPAINSGVATRSTTPAKAPGRDPMVPMLNKKSKLMWGIVLAEKEIRNVSREIEMVQKDIQEQVCTVCLRGGDNCHA